MTNETQLESAICMDLHGADMEIHPLGSTAPAVNVA